MGNLGKFHGRVSFAKVTRCDWPDCKQEANFQAPGPAKSRAKKYNFCLDHVRDYNQQYDYFQGFSPQDIQKAETEKYTWERETWPLGNASSTHHPSWKNLHELSDLKEFAKKNAPVESPLNRPLSSQDRKALAILGLTEAATSSEIKRHYKKLVKKHHPDSHSKDANSPKMLQSVMEAYNQLASGLKK